MRPGYCMECGKEYCRVTERHNVADCINGLKRERDSLRTMLEKADKIILDIHAQITTFSKYTASRVYEWKDLRSKNASSDLKEFDDNGRDE